MANPFFVTHASSKKRIYVVLLSIVINIFFWSCKSRTKNEALTNDKSKNTQVHIDLPQVLKQKTAKTVNVLYDEYFKSSKQYLGYDILPIIDSVIHSGLFDTTNSIIIFECTDGYKPTMPLATLYEEAKPYIVYKDLKEKGNKKWPDSIENKFSPYYLVWDSVKKDDHSYAWPYGLVSITLSWKDEQNKSIYPANNASLITGFNLFKDNCMKCHSLNGIGGSMAPEFNVPKNITEYWKGEDIIAFARNPKSYRRTSMMPPVTNIQESDFKEIISYLKYMKDYKVSDGP